MQAGPQFGPAGPSNPVCARAFALRAARVRPLSAATPGRAWPPHFLPPHPPLAYLGPFSNTPLPHPQIQPALRPSQGQGQHRSLPHQKPQSLMAAGQRRTSSPGKRGDRGEGKNDVRRAGGGRRGFQKFRFPADQFIFLQSHPSYMSSRRQIQAFEAISCAKTNL